MNKSSFVSSFALKLIAIITMTIDHIAVFLKEFAILSYSDSLYMIMRIIGRLSLPLFAFAICQGVLHTKNIKKYLLRLGLSAIIISFAIFIIKTFTISIYVGNIFIDLFLGALILSLLRLPKYKKLYSLIPIGVSCLLVCNFIPNYIRPMYHLYGITLIVGYFLADSFANLIKRYYQDKLSFKDEETFVNSPFYRTLQNILAICSLVIVNCIFYIIGKYNDYLNSYLLMSMQVYSILSGAFLLLYNGKLGYNKKWFQYGCYVYYPIHIAIIYGIIYLLV